MDGRASKHHNQEGEPKALLKYNKIPAFFVFFNHNRSVKG